MEKKTMDTLRTMICGELEDIAKKGTLDSHETLDVLKDLLESEKNLRKIEKYQMEKEEKEKEKEMGMDMGYSQRKYYIDADYDPRQPMNSYARGGQGMGQGGNSYGYSMGNVYDGGGYARGMNGNSYMYYDPRYEQTPMYSMARGNSYARGYSGTGDKQEMISELKAMMNETQDETMKMAISEALSKIK